MASPKLEVFFLFDNTGAPLTGQTGMTFARYNDTSGTAVSQPTISELGGGSYGFTPNLPADPNKGLIYTVNTNLANPRYVSRYVRPEDYNADGVPALNTLLTTLKKINSNNWKIFTTGIHANHLVYFDDDTTTVLYRFLLTDATDTPTTSAPFARTLDP